MKALLKAIRFNNALHVIQRMNNRMTVVDACKEVGIPRSTFYDICKKNPEAFARFQEMVYVSALERLYLILLNQTKILQKIIDDGLADTTKPRDRLAIYKTLNEHFDKLMESLPSESRAGEDYLEFTLQGPVLREGASRFTASQTVVTIESEG